MNIRSILLCSLLLVGSEQIMQSSDSNQYSEFLMDAVRQQDVNKVKTLLKTYVDVNKFNQYDETSLMLAVKGENLEIVTLLIEADANVNQVNQYGETALFHFQSIEMAQLLLDAGANVNVRNHQGQTVLWLCSSEDEFNLFVQKGGNINAQDNNGSTVLHDCVTFYWRLDRVGLLIQAGASIFIKNNQGKNFLDTCFEYGSFKYIEHVINSDAFNIHDKNSTTFFTTMITEVITDIKGKYLSENTACGYSYSEFDYEKKMQIIRAMVNKGMRLYDVDTYYTSGYDILDQEIYSLDALTKGSVEEQSLCAEYQVLPKTLSLYNYKKAMKIELATLEAELKAQSEISKFGGKNGLIAFMDNNPLFVFGAFITAEVAAVYALNNLNGDHDDPLNQFVNTTIDTVGSAVTDFVESMDVPSFLSILK